MYLWTPFTAVAICSPPSDVTDGTRRKLRVWKTDWSHSVVELQSPVQLQQCHIAVVPTGHVVSRMFEELFDGNLLFETIYCQEMVLPWFK